jgi:hypothetical protein
MIARVVVNVREKDRSGVNLRRKFMEGKGRGFVDVRNKKCFGKRGLELNTNRAGAGRLTKQVWKEKWKEKEREGGGREEQVIHWLAGDGRY